MIRFDDGSKYMSMKYDAAGRLLRRTTRVPFRDIAVGGKLQQERAKADLAALSSRFVARNGAAASATSTAGSSSGSSAATPSLAPSTTSQGASSSASSSGASAISGKVSKRAFGVTDYDYCGNIVYKNGVPTIYREDGFTTLARMRFPEFHYYIRDHQGNIRGVTDGRGNIEQQNDYYPFGGMMASSTGGAVQPYRYTGKELVRFQGLDWLDYGARWYDPAILHWNGADGMAEKNNSVSAYTFCHNNPANRVDPVGKDD